MSTVKFIYDKQKRIIESRVLDPINVSYKHLMSMNTVVYVHDAIK